MYFKGGDSTFCQVPTYFPLSTDFQGFPSRSCIDRFEKYWAQVHLKHEPYEHVICIDSLPPDEIDMKKDLNIFNEGLSHEKVFGSSEVKPYLQRKWFIDTCVIEGAENNQGKMEIFGDNRESSFFLTGG